MRKISYILAVLLIAGFAFADGPYREQSITSTSDFLRQPQIESPFTGLLDPSRLTMTHQFGMNYSSYGGSGYTQGYYLNSLRYQFNAPVAVTLRLGVTNNPFVQSSNGPGEGGLASMMQNAEFFGGADIDWQPRENVYFRFSIDKLPPGMYYGNSYYNPADPFRNRYESPLRNRYDPFYPY